MSVKTLSLADRTKLISANKNEGLVMYSHSIMTAFEEQLVAVAPSERDLTVGTIRHSLYYHAMVT